MQLTADTHQLRDGRSALIRPAEPEDRATYVAAVASLSPRSRYQRFFANKPTLLEREIDRLMDLDHQVVWLAVDPATGTGLGAARYVETGSGTAETAIAVLDACHGQGLGGALLDHVIAGAREHGLSTLVAECLVDNEGARGLLISRGFHADRIGRGVIGWRLALT